MPDSFLSACLYDRVENWRGKAPDAGYRALKVTFCRVFVKNNAVISDGYTGKSKKSAKN